MNDATSLTHVLRAGASEAADLADLAELAERCHAAELALHACRQELAEARHAAAQAQGTKRQLLALLHHELRTPLQTLIGLGDSLCHGCAAVQQQQQLDRIAGASQSLLGLVDDLLDIGELDAHRLTLQLRNFELDELLQSVHQAVAVTARRKGLALSIVNEGVPNRLRGDPVRLRQALLNYASNAVKFTEHGRVTVRVDLIESLGQRLALRFEVEDTGLGIAPEQVAHVFDSLQGGGTDGRHDPAGSGLGLSLTRQLVEMMGGCTGVESALQGGSRFWFTACLERAPLLGGLTAPPPDSFPVDAVARLARDFAGARVLVVEDNELNREIVADWMQAAALQVQTASHGLRALELLRQADADVDLILMDMHMPGLDGIATTRAIRALARWQSVPIIGMSASAPTDSGAACRDAGMSDFVVKPMTPTRCHGLIWHWLQQTGASQPAVNANSAMPTDPAWQVNPAPADIDGDPQQRACYGQLRQLPGLQVDVGLQAVRGRLPRYLDLLQRFADQHRGDMPTLCAHLLDGQLDAARLLLHNLKGLASSLGHLGVADAARKLEADLQSAEVEPGYTRRIDARMAALDNQLLALREALLPAAATHPPA